jgi:hypothetical protein
MNVGSGIHAKFMAVGVGSELWRTNMALVAQLMASLKRKPRELMHIPKANCAPETRKKSRAPQATSDAGPPFQVLAAVPKPVAQ